jgi:hypothetical protein
MERYGGARFRGRLQYVEDSTEARRKFEDRGRDKIGDVALSRSSELVTMWFGRSRTDEPEEEDEEEETGMVGWQLDGGAADMIHQFVEL